MPFCLVYIAHCLYLGSAALLCLRFAISSLIPYYVRYLCQSLSCVHLELDSKRTSHLSFHIVIYFRLVQLSSLGLHLCIVSTLFGLFTLLRRRDYDGRDGAKAKFAKRKDKGLNRLYSGIISLQRMDR